LTETTDINVNLSRQGQETTLNDILRQLKAIGGIQAEITADGNLKISQVSTNDEISFANDTSGTLAALGLNTFFTGSTADDLGVNSMLQKDPALFAASSGGIGQDANNAKVLANFLDRPLDSRNGASLSDIYDKMTGTIAQASSQAQAVANGADSYENTLRGQQSSISGVNLDEEAINMIQYQRAYQASAKFIAAISELMDTLVNL
jgi:flagellar hook-associated protein 1